MVMTHAQDAATNFSDDREALGDGRAVYTFNLEPISTAVKKAV